MLRLESKKIEKMIRDGKLEYALGIDIHDENGECVITALPMFKSDAQRFEKLFAGRYFSVDAHKWVISNIGARLAKFGYFPNRMSRRLTKSYILRTPPENSGNALLIHTPPSKSAIRLDFGELIDRGHLIAARFCDGICVSCAYTDVPILPDTAKNCCIEIGVETAVQYRNNGYAAEAVSLLCSELFSRSLKPIYITSNHNTASKKLAAKLGFEPLARNYYCIFYRNIT